MFESFLHLIGICPDSMSHPNLMNLFGLGVILSGLLLFFKNKVIFLKNKIKKFFKKNENK